MLIRIEAVIRDQIIDDKDTSQCLIGHLPCTIFFELKHDRRTNYLRVSIIRKLRSRIYVTVPGSRLTLKLTPQFSKDGGTLTRTSCFQQPEQL